jgi:hypothetical protein
MTKLMGLQFRIIYKKGKENIVADALSRVPSLLQIQACSELKPAWIHEVVNSYVTDAQAQELLTQLAVASPNEQGYTLHQGIIRIGSRIWVDNNSALSTKLIEAFHSTALRGHSGVQATYVRLKQLFHWRGLKLDVENFIK